MIKEGSIVVVTRPVLGYQNHHIGKIFKVTSSSGINGMLYNKDGLSWHEYELQILSDLSELEKLLWGIDE